MPVFMSSISTLIGAMRVNRSLPSRAAVEDLGGKVAVLISAVNLLNANVSLIQAGLTANGGSSLSGTAFTSTLGSMANFSTT